MTVSGNEKGTRRKPMVVAVVARKCIHFVAYVSLRLQPLVAVSQLSDGYDAFNIIFYSLGLTRFDNILPQRTQRSQSFLCSLRSLWQMRVSPKLKAITTNHNDMLFKKLSAADSITPKTPKPAFCMKQPMDAQNELLNELISACQYALRYFEAQQMAANTLDDDFLDALDAQMMTQEADMIPKLSAALGHSALLLPHVIS